jgi:hypothetical protein
MFQIREDVYLTHMEIAPKYTRKYIKGSKKVNLWCLRGGDPIGTGIEDI